MSEYWAPLTADFIFNVSVSYEKFDLDSVVENFYEPSGTAKSDFNEVQPISFIHKAEAMSPPEIFQFKIKKIQPIVIGNNQYYTYSFIREGNRTDIFIIPQKNDYIKFKFYDQNEAFIKNILTSVQRTDGVFSGSTRIIQNSDIGLVEAEIPKHWNSTNTFDSTSISNVDSSGTIKMLISDKNITSNKFLNEIENYENDKEKSRADIASFRQSVNCSGGIMGLKEEIHSCASYDSEGNIEAYGKIQGRNLFIYIEVDSLANKNFGMDFVARIINSIVVN